MAKSIKVDGKSIDYEVLNLVKFADGIQYETAGSVAAAAVLKQYKTEKASQVPPVVETPAPGPAPVLEAPVIIVKPSPGTAREISISDYGKLKDIQNENFKLKAGIYGDQYWLTSLKNVSIDLSEAQFTTKNMPTHELKGVHENVIFWKPSFKDTSGDGFKYRTDNLPFGTVIKGLQILGSNSVNSGAIFSGDGSIGDKGFGLSFQGLTIKDFVFKNSPGVGTIVYCQALEDFEIANGIIDNINSTTDIHNGILMIAGNGKLHDIKCTHHQGDLMRAVPHQILSTGKKLDIYNNLVFDSRKYGAFEVQVYGNVKASPFFKPADTIVRNNTIGQLNTSKNWDAKLIDVYDTYGRVDLINNLGFDLFQANGNPILILANQMQSAATLFTEIGSRYFKTAKEAVVDISTLKSMYAGIGAQ
jgi:hypothetical protein